MARKKKKTTQTQATPAIRSNLHQVLAGRKSGGHRPDREKRAAQKLRRELEDQ